MSDDRAPPPRARLSIQRLFPLALLAAGLAATIWFDLHHFLSFDALRENRETILNWRAANEVLAAVAYIAIYCAAIAISLPGAIWLTILGGFLFGSVQGGFLVVIAATSGATIIFLAARYAFADYFYEKVGGVIRRLEDGFRRNAFSYLLFLRLVPLFPFWLVNLVPAFVGVSLPAYVVATLIGTIPGTFIYTSLGSGLGRLFEKGELPNLGIIFHPEILLPLLALGLISLIPVVYRNRRRLRDWWAARRTSREARS